MIRNEPVTWQHYLRTALTTTAAAGASNTETFQ